MSGKDFKQIAGRIPDSAEMLRLTEKYVSWRESDGKAHCYSFHPEKLDKEL